MPIATWGPKVFDTSSNSIIPMKDLTNTAALKTEETEVSGGKSTIKVKGEGLETLSFNVRLDHAYVGVADEIKSWKSLETGKIAYPLIIGNSVFGPAKWLLMTVAVSETRIGPFGVILGCSLALSFVESGSQSTATGSASGSRKAKKKKTGGGGSTLGGGAGRRVSKDTAAG
jgi:hypothetical protein